MENKLMHISSVLIARGCMILSCLLGLAGCSDRSANESVASASSPVIEKNDQLTQVAALEEK